MENVSDHKTTAAVITPFIVHNLKMGIDIVLWRVRIGSFAQPNKSKSCLHGLTLTFGHISLSNRVALFLLLIVEGVESNPGPGGRGRTSRSNAGNRGRGRGTVQSTSVTENVVQTRGASRSHSQSQSEQPTLNAWISSGRISTGPRPEQTFLNSSRARSSSDIESLFGRIVIRLI